MTMSSVPDPAQEGSAISSVPPPLDPKLAAGFAAREGSAISSVPPPLDPELAAGFAVIAEHIPRVFTLDMISSMRQQSAAMPSVSDEELSRGGAFEITDAKPGAYKIVIEAKPPYRNIAKDGLMVTDGQATDAGEITLEK